MGPTQHTYNLRQRGNRFHNASTIAVSQLPRFVIPVTIDKLCDGSPNILPTLCKALKIMLRQPFLKVTILTAQLKTVTFAIDLSQNKTRLYTLLSPSYKF